MKREMPYYQPRVTAVNNQSYIVWGCLRYWIDDLSEATKECITEACEAVGVTSDHELLEAAIDERVDAATGAMPVYLDARKWEAIR